jgi:two-component system sensor histidine kinase YesM
MKRETADVAGKLVLAVMVLQAAFLTGALLYCLLVRFVWWTMLAALAVLLAAMLLQYYTIYRPLAITREMLEKNQFNTIQDIERYVPKVLMSDMVKILYRRYHQALAEEHRQREVSNKVRFSVLQNQINPHFLYNTMESVRGLAYIEGADRVADMTEAMAAFFRYNIGDGEDIVYLEDELTNIKYYFVIQKYRFSNRFQLQLNFDERDYAIIRYPIPKLTIQPLVENALFHGLEKRRGNGQVSISIRISSTRMHICVDDNGAGMSDEQVWALNDRLSHNLQEYGEEGRASDMGVALVNINQRLKFLYGDDYGLSFASTINKGTEVRLMLPYPAPAGLRRP